MSPAKESRAALGLFAQSTIEYILAALIAVLLIGALLPFLSNLELYSAQLVVLLWSISSLLLFLLELPSWILKSTNREY